MISERAQFSPKFLTITTDRKDRNTKGQFRRKRITSSSKEETWKEGKTDVERYGGMYADLQGWREKVGETSDQEVDLQI